MTASNTTLRLRYGGDSSIDHGRVWLREGAKRTTIGAEVRHRDKLAGTATLTVAQITSSGTYPPDDYDHRTVQLCVGDTAYLLGLKINLVAIDNTSRLVGTMLETAGEITFEVSPPQTSKTE